MLKFPTLAALLTALCACSTPPCTVSALQISASPPANLTTPAQRLHPLLWPAPSSKTTVSPSATPTSSTP